jgi:hypothetical protein
MSGTLASTTPPAPAAAVGYDTETLGPSVTLGQNWYPFSFQGAYTTQSGATQNADGSLAISGAGTDGYNGNVSTAVVGTTPTNWTGEAFGGGGYFQATLSFTGQSYGGDQPAFWANDVEMMASQSVAPNNPAPWPGQATSYGDWMEADFAEWDASKPNQYGYGLINWYGPIGSGDNTRTQFAPATVPTGTDFSQPHTYGFLWMPATSTTQGSAEWFFDGKQIGSTVYWNQYNPATPPSPLYGSSAMSVMDTRHLALILG